MNNTDTTISFEVTPEIYAKLEASIKVKKLSLNAYMKSVILKELSGRTSQRDKVKYNQEAFGNKKIKSVRKPKTELSIDKNSKSKFKSPDKREDKSAGKNFETKSKSKDKVDPKKSRFMSPARKLRLAARSGKLRQKRR